MQGDLRPERAAIERRSSASSITVAVRPLVAGWAAAGVTLKCFPMKNPPEKKIITDLICLLLLKYRRLYEKFLHYRIAPPRKVPPGRQFTGKNPSCPNGRRAGRIFAGKLSAWGELF